MSCDLHLTKRQPQGRRYAFGRFPTEIGGVEYRLFRRDFSNRTHVEVRRFAQSEPRAKVAREVWQARKLLRDRVDAFDLAFLMTGKKP